MSSLKKRIVDPEEEMVEIPRLRLDEIVGINRKDWLVYAF